MDDAIRGIPSVRGPLSISHNRRHDGRRGKDFEEAMSDRGERAERELDADDTPDSRPEVHPKMLKGRLPLGRKDEQGRRHIDVLA